MAYYDQLNPSLRDPNYLMRRGRVVKLQQAFKNILKPGDITVLLDLGGRNAPYRSLACDALVNWLVADLVIASKTTVQADAQALPFTDGVFDVILCLQVLELVPDVQGSVNEMFRGLKRGGYLILSNPAAYPPYGNARWRIMPEGYMQLLSRFAEVQIDAECNTAASFFRTMNVYLDILTQQIPVVRTVMRYVVFPVMNILGWWANTHLADQGFAANYFVVAQKG